MDKPCCVGVVRNADGLKGKELAVGKNNLKAYSATPGPSERNGKRMGVVVIHDIFGFKLPNPKYIADHFASCGFDAIVPDLYNGKGLSRPEWPATETEITEPLEGDAFTKWFGEITSEGFWEKFMKDIDDCTAFLRRKGCYKFAVIGFCWGGKAAEMVAKTGKVHAAISCHGCMHNAEEHAKVKCPILYITIPKDDFFNQEAIDGIRAAGGSVKIFDSYHGFMVRGDFANDAKLKAMADEGFAMAIELVHKACLKKPKMINVKDLNPSSKNVNVVVKVVKAPEPVESKSMPVFEAQVGDETGVVTISLREEQKGSIVKGSTLVIRNAFVKMFTGRIRIAVDKWGKLDTASGATLTEEVKTSHDMSEQEYELVADK